MNAIYRNMDRVALDAAYNNRAAVPDSTEISDAYIAASEVTYRSLPCSRDLRYGDQPAQRYDWFYGDGSARPVVVFIHGGYWQTRAKEHYACVADGLVGRGYSVVMAEYTLAPAASMTGIVTEIGALLDHLAKTMPTGDASPPRLILCGHSAGGHLAACYRDHPSVDGVLGISGVYDLEPMRLSYLNDALQLSEEEVVSLSPARHVSNGKPTILAYGGAELAEFHVQSREYLDALVRGRQPVQLAVLPGKNHFTVLDELRSPSGGLTQLVDQLARAGTRPFSEFESAAGQRTEMFEKT